MNYWVLSWSGFCLFFCPQGDLFFANKQMWEVALTWQRWVRCRFPAGCSNSSPLAHLALCMLGQSRMNSPTSTGHRATDSTHQITQYRNTELRLSGKVGEASCESRLLHLHTIFIVLQPNKHLLGPDPSRAILKCITLDVNKHSIHIIISAPLSELNYRFCSSAFPGYQYKQDKDEYTDISPFMLNSPFPLCFVKYSLWLHRKVIIQSVAGMPKIISQHTIAG